MNARALAKREAGRNNFATSEIVLGYPSQQTITSALARRVTKRKLLMKFRLITLIAAGAAMLATISIAQAQDQGGNGPRHRKWGNALEHMTKNLDLTPEQQAKPQIKAARQESKEKMIAIRDNVRAQIRPLLTPAQQQRWDAIQKAREDMRKARQEMREATKQ
jgi:hypothetical protein